MVAITNDGKELWEWNDGDGIKSITIIHCRCDFRTNRFPSCSARSSLNSAPTIAGENHTSAYKPLTNANAA